MNEDLKKLYEAVSSEFDIGSFDEFSSKMQTFEDRKSFYNLVSEEGFDLGDYKEYESRLSSNDSSKKKDNTTESSGQEDSTDGTETTGTGESQSISYDKKKKANFSAKQFGVELPYPELEKPDKETGQPLPPDLSEEEFEKLSKVDADPEVTAQQVGAREDQRKFQKEVEEKSDKPLKNTRASIGAVETGLGQLVSSTLSTVADINTMVTGEESSLHEIVRKAGEEMDRDAAIDKASLMYDPDDPEGSRERAESSIYDLIFEKGDYTGALKSTGYAILNSLPYSLAIMGGGATLGGGSTLAANVATATLGTTFGYGSSIAEDYARDQDIDATDRTQALAKGLVEGVGSLISRRLNNQFTRLIRGGKVSKKEALDQIMKPLKSYLSSTSKASLGEGVEEALQETASYLIDTWAGDQEFNMERMYKIAFDSFLVGTGSGGLMSGTANIVNDFKTKNSIESTAKKINVLNEEINSQTMKDKPHIRNRLIDMKKKLQTKMHEQFVKNAPQVLSMSKENQKKARNLVLEIEELKDLANTSKDKSIIEDANKQIVEKVKQFNQLTDVKKSNNKPKESEGSGKLDDEGKSVSKETKGKTGTGESASGGVDAKEGGLDGDNNASREDEVRGLDEKDSGSGKRAGKEGGKLRGKVEEGTKSRENTDDARGVNVKPEQVPVKRERIQKAAEKSGATVAKESDKKSVKNLSKKPKTKGLGRLFKAAKNFKAADGSELQVAVAPNRESFNEVSKSVLTKKEYSQSVDEDGNVAAGGFYDPESHTIFLNEEEMGTTDATHEFLHPILNSYLQRNPENAARLAKDAILNDQGSETEGSLQDFVNMYEESEGNTEAVVEGLSRMLSQEVRKPTIPNRIKEFINKILDSIGIDRSIALKGDEDYKELAIKIHKSLSEGRSVKDQGADQKTGVSSRKLNRDNNTQDVNIGNKESVSNEVNKVKSSKGEEGATFNLDGSKYEEDGLVVPLASTNTTSDKLSFEEISDFVNKNIGEAVDQDNVKFGIYKFPDSDQVSIDLNVVVPSSKKEAAVEFAKQSGQESLFNLGTFENIKTGADGKNPKSYTSDQFKEIAEALGKGEVPFKRDGRQNTDFFTGKAKKRSSDIPYEPVLDVDQDSKIAKDYKKFTNDGNFTSHISKMIAGFAEKQMKVAEAIVDLNADSFLDLGTSEGGLIKTVAANAPKMKVVGIDPNPAMLENYNKTPDVPNAEYRLEALGSSWVEDDGTKINEFKPKQKFDVINEDYVFQFINNDRKSQVAQVKDLLKKDGVFITSEKFHTANQAKNEQKKYDHQKKYFDKDQLTEDKQTIVIGMSDDMVNDVEYYNTLKDNFKYVHEFWNAGNFKGFIATNDINKLSSMLDTIGDLSSDFTDTESQTKGNTVLAEEGLTPVEIMTSKKGDSRATSLSVAAKVFDRMESDKLHPTSSEKARISRFLTNAVKEMSIWLSNPIEQTGMTWYTRDMEIFDERVKETIPNIQTEEDLSLFKAIMAITSGGQRVTENLKTAYAIWSMSPNPKKGDFVFNWGDKKKTFYEKQKKKSLKSPKSVTGKVVEENSRYIYVQPVDFWGNAKGKAKRLLKSKYERGNSTGFTNRPTIVSSKLNTIQRIINNQGGLTEAIKWLNEQHPVSELREYNKNVPDADGSMRKNPTTSRVGYYVLGEKLGAFYANLSGQEEEVTMDLWWSRTWNRYMGTMFDNANNIQEAPRNDAERKTMKKAVSHLSEITGLTNHELQAALWYMEQNLYTKMGVKSDSDSYIDALNNLENEIRKGKESKDGLSKQVREKIKRDDQRRQDAKSRTDALESNKNARQVQGVSFKKAPPKKSEAFKKWFKDSKVVDSKGEPKTLYHGTKSDFDEFKGDGFYFTDNKSIADKYGENVIPVYLSLQNPKITDGKGKAFNKGGASRLDIPKAKKEGYDGIIAKNVDDRGGLQNQYIAFYPEQIKSVNNKGGFSSKTPKIHFRKKPVDPEFNQKGVPADVKNALRDSEAFLKNEKIRESVEKNPNKYHFDLESGGWWGKMGTNLREGIQDDKIRVLKFINQVKEVATVKDSENYYQKLNLQSKAMRAIKAINHEVASTNNDDSLFSRVIEAGLDVEELGKYMAAIHAPERNASIKENNMQLFRKTEDSIRKREHQINNNELTDKQLKKLEKELNKLYEKRARIANKVANDYGGLTDQQAEDFLNSLPEDHREAYEYFAKEYRDRVITPILDVKQEAGIITEEQRDQIDKFEYYVPMKVDEFSLSDRVDVGNKSVKKRVYSIKGTDKFGFNERVNPVFQSLNELAASYIEASKNEAGNALYNLAKEHPSNVLTVIDGRFKEETDPNTGVKKVIDKTDEKVKENSLKVFVDGKTKYVTINDPKLRKAILRDNTVGRGLIQNKLLRGFANYFRSVNTMYNPEFLVSNVMRDFQAAAISSGKEIDLPKRKLTQRLIGAMPKAQKAIWKARRNNDYSGVYGKAFRELEEAGGLVSWYRIPDAQNQVKSLQRAINRPKRKSQAIKNVKKIGKFVEDVSDVAEVSTRLAVYKVARDSGMSLDQAAMLAKEVTVNFDKKGTWGSMINTLYLFSNAGIQGTTRIATAVATSGKVRQFAGAMFLFGAMEAFLFAAAGDEEKYKKIPDWIKERNYILPNPWSEKGYITIPLPYGYNVFKAVGNNAYDVGLHYYQGYGGKTAGEGFSSSLIASLNAFNPLQSATIGQGLAPTIFDPIVQHLENTTFYGTPLAPKKWGYNDRVESDTHYKSTPQIWVDIAKGINSLTNFSDSSLKGEVDMSPEVYENYVKAYSGGLPRFLIRTGRAGWSMLDKEAREKIELNDIPIARKVLNQIPEGYDRNFAYEIKKESSVRLLHPAEEEQFLDAVNRAAQEGFISLKQARTLITQVNNNQAEVESKLSK